MGEERRPWLAHGQLAVADRGQEEQHPGGQLPGEDDLVPDLAEPPPVGEQRAEQLVHGVADLLDQPDLAALDDRAGQPQVLYKKIIASGKNISRSRVLIMGATFKEDVSDIRNSKVADIVKELKSFGVKVDIVDPHADSKRWQPVSTRTGQPLVDENHDHADHRTVADQIPPDVAAQHAVGERRYQRRLRCRQGVRSRAGRALEAEGIVFIGPSPRAIEAMDGATTPARIATAVALLALDRVPAPAADGDVSTLWREGRQDSPEAEHGRDEHLLVADTVRKEAHQRLRADADLPLEVVHAQPQLADLAGEDVVGEGGVGILQGFHSREKAPDNPPQLVITFGP